MTPEKDTQKPVEAASVDAVPLEALDPILTDENAGMGGSYTIDPKTGVRTKNQE
jgi:hypothetical protein